ncbi:hypothetical protein GWO43_26925 [candidate division KSB1 bacterium]|nr:hypothetical protein [candidate division KSB1 bacterium]NIR70191.1 hypothetical protein [candidate division KSB1 bacterium]NIS27578.1 hypothetical protein [candidate division KSB1 bacterium]NIT74430.1 hypothetical protein [candidate division KSB1 bacterium]NIU28295.1 hypothetical protein [candidate division KSB1 bacterium]
MFLLHSAADVLFHALRTNVLKHTRWAKTSMGTLRLRFLKIGASVRELKTRICFDLPSSYPLTLNTSDGHSCVITR